MGIDALKAAFNGKRVLVTGNSGFKGSWLQLWLQLLGARVTGIALQPESAPNHWHCLKLESEQHWIDIRDFARTQAAVRQLQPDVIFHLAAQSLVRESYRAPLETWQTNVMGTAHLLEACRSLGQPCAIIVVTSDKCYLNRGQAHRFREDDPLGGHDPYSASKAGTELVAASYRDSFLGPDAGVLLATARAGNVVGGGDWATDRLVPDAVRSRFEAQPLAIRFPDATRPWQHVLEAIYGYLLLAGQLLEGKQAFARAWNFGPHADQDRPVAEVLLELQKHWPELSWEVTGGPQVHEAPLLALDSDLAMRELGWQPRWSFAETLTQVARWYSAWYGSGEAISEAQINEYMRALSA